MRVRAAIIDPLPGTSLPLEAAARIAQNEPMRGHESMARMPPGMNAKKGALFRSVNRSTSKFANFAAPSALRRLRRDHECPPSARQGEVRKSEDYNPLG